jgi:hypothetical protein
MKNLRILSNPRLFLAAGTLGVVIVLVVAACSSDEPASRARPTAGKAARSGMAPAAGPDADTGATADMGAPDGERRWGRGRGRCTERFAGLDADQDGKVTRAEFLAAKHRFEGAEERFDRRDADGDGVLTEAELCAHRRGRGMRGGRGGWGRGGMGEGRGSGRGGGPEGPGGSVE